MDTYIKRERKKKKIINKETRTGQPRFRADGLYGP